MMHRTTNAFLALCLLLVLYWPGAAQAAPQKLPVVASFSILADMVREVGGDKVQITTLVGPGGDAHVYQPTPSNAKAILEARVVFINGLEFEGWILRLIESSNYIGQVTIASQGISMLRFNRAGKDNHHHHHLYDPHAWQSLASSRVYVENIYSTLAMLDAANASFYRANADRYLQKIDELDAWTKEQIATVPPQKRKVITSHDAFGYFARDYGVTFIPALGVSTDSEASAADIARLIDLVRAEKLHAVFIENMADPRLIRQLENDAGVQILGTLYSDSLSPPGGPADTYLNMFRHNVTQLVAGMRH